MLRQVDKTEKSVVFKATVGRNKPAVYRVFPISAIGDSSQCQEVKTLTEARVLIGKATQRSH